MSQAEVNPFSDASILQSVRQKLKGAVYKQSGLKTTDIRSFFSHKHGVATLGELKNVVRRELKLSQQFVPDPALSKLVAYLASPMQLLLPNSRDASPAPSPRGGSSSTAPAGPVGGSAAAGGATTSSKAAMNTTATTSTSSSGGFGAAAGADKGSSSEGSNTLAQIRANPDMAGGPATVPLLGEMLNLPLLPSELPTSNNNAISNSTTFELLELHKFVQHGAPNVSEKAEAQRIMERKKAERCVRKFQVAIHDKLMETYEAGCVSSNINYQEEEGRGGGAGAITDHAVYVRYQFQLALTKFTEGSPRITLHALKKFLREKLNFMNWDFGETDCTTLWYAMYRFPDLNLLEQCRMASEMELTAQNFTVQQGNNHNRYPRLEQSSGKLSPRQKKTQKFLYPGTDEKFSFFLRDLVSLLDLPKKSGLAIEAPDFRMPNTSETNTYQLGADGGGGGDVHQGTTEKLQDKYRRWCMARNRLSANFSSSGRTNPPRTRLHSNTVQHEQWRLNHTLGY